MRVRRYVANLAVAVVLAAGVGTVLVAPAHAGPQGVPVVCYSATRATYYWSIENSWKIQLHRWLHGRYSCLNTKM